MGVRWSSSPLVLIIFLSTTSLGSFLFNWSNTISVWTRQSLRPLVPTLSSIGDSTLTVCGERFRQPPVLLESHHRYDWLQESMFRIGTEGQRLLMRAGIESIC